jgi:hypothetical protein
LLNQCEAIYGSKRMVANNDTSAFGRNILQLLAVELNCNVKFLKKLLRFYQLLIKNVILVNVKNLVAQILLGILF